MKNMNKKGFTIVELVIVIAVIAILAAVLIPTFAGIVEKANESAALQEATNTYKALLTEKTVVAPMTDDDGTDDVKFTVNGSTNELAEIDVDEYIVVDGYTYSVTDGALALIENDDFDMPENYVALTGDYANVYFYTAPATQGE